MHLTPHSSCSLRPPDRLTFRCVCVLCVRRFRLSVSTEEELRGWVYDLNEVIFTMPLRRHFFLAKFTPSVS